MPKSTSLHVDLNERFCARLKTTTATIVTDHYDIEVKNLSLRLLPPTQPGRKGTLSWRYGYRFSGKGSVLTIGKYPDWPAKEARARAREIRVCLDRGLDPRVELYPRPEPPAAPAAKPADTVAKMYWRYAKEKLSEQSNSHRINTVGYFERHVLKAWDGRDVHSLTKRDASDLIQTVKTENGPIAANRLASALSAWGSFMVGAGILEDPHPFLRLPKTTEQERQRSLVTIREDGSLDLDEIIAVWRAAERLGGPPGRFVRLLCTSPLRRDEAVGLERGEVNPEGDTGILPPARCKGGRRTDKAFLIPFNTLARPILAECLDTGPYYFSKSGRRPISGHAHTKEAIDNIIREMRGAPLPAWTFHDLRRSIRTALSGLKVTDEIGEAVLNHLPAKLLRTYTVNSFAAEKRAALQLWADHFAAALANAHYNSIDPEVCEAAE